MKLGYKIIIALLIVAAIFYIRSIRNQKLERFEQKAQKLMTDIRHRDYFSFQEELAPELRQSVSIEGIQKFMDPLKIERGANVAVTKIEEQNSTHHIQGTLHSKKAEIPFEMLFHEDNSSRLLLLSTKVGNSTLESEGSVFPFTQK